ncbi:glycosyltransferase family protein [Congregibacter brevis]|uniref:Glycosyltransferase family protein n=1 Tax=Congregibacter brevis TaxID=3081201 RepID=A0ABZ0IG18_9GAMM|nr:glycosyltransferase family protein [Congregibacter sp. IMCC45268]
MKILYGVQGTGNGHLSRARAMARAFAARNLDVDYLFSGRSLDRYFDMHVFGQFCVREGLTFACSNGKLSYLKTCVGNNYGRFLRDVLTLDLSVYDLVLTDFEPITAWAGWLRGKTVVSIGHQPAFDHRVPMAGHDLRSRFVMRMFAPGGVRLGMHWDSFQAPILPPIVNVEHAAVSTEPRKVVVYLPFENQLNVQAVLAQIPEYDFYIYAPDNLASTRGNLHLLPTSLKGFQDDLSTCAGVICNAGFELSSECIALGKRLLVKPLDRQMEQSSNALALSRLGYGETLENLQIDQIRKWLGSSDPVQKVRYPDVASEVVKWLCDGNLQEASQQDLSDRLWDKVVVEF